MSDIQLSILLAQAFAVLLPLYPASIKYKGIALVLKMPACYIFVLTIEQLAIGILWYQKQNNFFLFHIGNMAESVALLLMYREIFKKYIANTNKYVYRKIFIVLIPSFIVFAIVNAIYWQPLTAYPSNTRTVLSIMALLFSTLFFHKHTYSLYPNRIEKFPAIMPAGLLCFGLIWGCYGFMHFL